MGKASSTKKVARVAKVGGKSAKQRRNLGFPVLIVGLLLAGGLAVFAARHNINANANLFPSYLAHDHIHEAYAIYDCDHFLPPIPTFESSFGIHTHGDGVLHIHPYLASASGKNATLSVFDDGGGISMSSKGVRYTGVNVHGSCKGKPATLRIAEWTKVVDSHDKPLKLGKPDKIYTKDFGKVRLDHNGGALTVFWGPADATIPPPNSIAGLVSALGGNEGGATPTTSAGSATTTAGAATTTAGTASTVAGSATTAAGAATTVAGSATTTAGTATTVAGSATTTAGN